MILAQGDMFAQPSWPQVLLFTGNSTIKSNGALVMGRGAALQARERFPECDFALGKLICSTANPYGIVYFHCNLPIGPEFLGVFQVKFHYSEPAMLVLINHSVDLLNSLARVEWKGLRVWMNFPGIGYGRLSRESVLPLLEGLPNNVTVWEKG